MRRRAPPGAQTLSYQDLKEATIRFDLPTTGGSINFSLPTPDRTVDVEENKEKGDALRLLILLTSIVDRLQPLSRVSMQVELNINGRDLILTNG